MGMLYNISNIHVQYVLKFRVLWVGMHIPISLVVGTQQLEYDLIITFG